METVQTTFRKSLFLLKASRVYLGYRLRSYRPALVMLRITNRCNQRCSFCVARKLQNGTELSTNQLLALVDDLADLGVPYLNITGGEPLLRQDLEQVAAHASRRHIRTMLNTNGLLVTEARASQLSRTFDMINVSLDGLEATHDRIRGKKGSFRLALQSLAMLRAQPNRKAKVFVHLVATSENIWQAEDFLKAMHGKADAASIMPAFSTKDKKVFSDPRLLRLWQSAYSGSYLQMSDLLFRKPALALGKEFCDAGKLYCSVLATGDVIACSNNPSLVMGNLNNQTFVAIWGSGATDSIQKDIDCCPGCFCRSTTEVSMLFRMSPFQLALRIPHLLACYRL
jgi:MoaA/NifB/PqqE/SkfB family radical SAM enzyme